MFSIDTVPDDDCVLLSDVEPSRRFRHDGLWIFRLQPQRMQTETFNPYSAPATQPDEHLLAADTEFLFNDKCVAGIGTITLPKICVVSGSRDDLVSRVTVLSWCNRWITWPRNAALFGVISYVPHLSFSGSTGPDATWFWLIGAGIVSIAVIALVASMFFRNVVTVHWSLSRRIHRRHRVLTSLLTVFVGLFSIGVIQMTTAIPGQGTMVISGLIALIAGASQFRSKRVLWVIGRHDGLLLIGGLSEEFLKETKRMADAHAARSGQRETP